MKTNSKTIGGWMLAFFLATIETGLGQTATSQDSLSSIQVELSSGQVDPLSLNATDMRAVRSLSESQLAAFVLALDATPIIPFASQPRKGMAGTFYSLQHPEWPPLPGNTSQSAVWQMNNFYLLDDVNYNYNAPVKSRTTMQAMSLSGPPSPAGGGDGGTNVYYPEGNSYPIPDYGTNLWIAQVAITNGQLAAVASNTLADVQYEILTNADLSTTNWASTGQFIPGSEDTNWTSFITLPVSLTDNLFFRLRSWASSDGSGLPDWWEQEYGVTDPYGDPDGDGWNNLQEYENGTDPTQFNTPPAPQGVTVNYNAINSTANLNWLPAPGPVTGYIITDSNGHTFTNSANITTFTGSVTNLPDLENYGDILVSYTVQASYAGGDSAASALVPLEPVNFSGMIVPGPEGVSELLVSSLPAGTAAIRLTQISFDGAQVQPSALVTNFEVAISSFPNNVCILPNLQATTGVGLYDDEKYYWAGQAVNTNGGLGASIYLGGVFMDAANGNYQTNWMVPPFYDGQVQLKQNLIFQLRAAGVYAPFQYDVNSNGVYAGYFTSPAGYACASFYDFPFYPNTHDLYSQTLNPIRPFLDNTLYRNFVFTSADVDFYGDLTTGANLDYAKVNLDEPVTYQFQGDPAALLATNDSRWLLYDASGLSYGEVGDSDVYRAGLVIPGADPNSLTMSSGFHNWFGLAYVSVAVAYQHFDGSGNPLGLATDVLPAGETHSFSDIDFGFLSANYATIYPETAQPQFQTVEYDFWQPATVYSDSYHPDGYSLPGNPYFSPTNASEPLIMTAVGSASTIAGYAKLAVQNAYSGVYGYLGQYFDQAYQIDTNGVVTTNTTGILSPYGSFFATEPGIAALVTMPDIDTGERGTCAVYSVALQLDKNHDGIMDSSFNGPDATSQISPMVCWVNNGQTVAGTGGGLDKDLPVPSNHPEQENDYAGKITCQRDLENFFRLWIRGVPQLPSDQGYTITFSMTALSGNPAINLYLSSDSAGGTGYLTDTNVAADQARTYTSPNPEYGVALATINAQQSYTLPSNFFDYNYPYYSRFLFEGAGIGLGQLTMTISQNSNVIVQASAYLDLHDVKDLYEQTHTENIDKSPPSTKISTLVKDKILPVNSAEDQQVILYVHGLNNSQFEYYSSSETMFKRLYWQGYQGRLAAFRWPSPVFSFLPSEINEISYLGFNTGEYISWHSGAALKACVDDLRSRLPGYTINLAAHSLGNVAANEAIREGAQVDNYALMQAAISAGAFDGNNASLTYSFLAATASSSPDADVLGGYSNCATNQCRRVNFYNDDDYALFSGPLNAWEGNQLGYKPDIFPYAGGDTYSYSFDGVNCYFDDTFEGNTIEHRMLTEDFEKKAFVARSRTKAVGAAGLKYPPNALTGGVISTNISLQNPNLGFVGGAAFGATRPDHSGEFTKPIQNSTPFYFQLMKVGFQLQPKISP